MARRHPRSGHATLWVAVIAWTQTLVAFGMVYRTRGKPGPDDDVVVCANYVTCDQRPVPYGSWNFREPPLCKEGQVMATVIKFRDWPHRWQ